MLEPAASVRPAPAPARPRLEGLTGLRFVAALHVVVYHFAAAAVAGAPAFVRHVQAAGHAAVSLFFVLSGFVLAYNYSEPLARGTVSRRRFWWARAARVYPLYLLCIVAELPIQLHAGTAPRTLALASAGDALGLQAWLPRITFVGNAPGWSISVELFFYALFPWLSARLFVRERRMVAALAAWMAIAVAAAALPWLPWLRGDAALLVKCAPLVRLPELVVGLGVGKLYLVSLRRPAPPERAADRQALVALAAIAALFAVEAALPRWFLHGLLVPPFALLVWAVARGGRLARALGAAPLRALGEASYALYLLQMPLHQAIGGRYEWTALPLCAFVVGLTAAALVAHALVERPAQRWLRRAAGV